MIDRPDVDTDQIIPKQFLKRIERTGYGKFRSSTGGSTRTGGERPGFELNQPAFAGAQDPAHRAATSAAGRRASTPPGRCRTTGFDVVIASWFGDIFRTNAAKIGIVLVALPVAQVKRLMGSSTSTGAQRSTSTWSGASSRAPEGRKVQFPFDECDPDRLLQRARRDRRSRSQHEDEIAA